MGSSEKITMVPGVGPKLGTEFARLGISTLHDMILFAPRGYDDRREERTLRMTSQEDATISCRITVLSHSEFPSRRGRTLKVTAIDEDGTRLQLLCFNRPFLKSQLTIGSSWYIVATVERYKGMYSAASFELKKTREEAGIGRILPVYPLSGELTEKMMRRASSFALTMLSPLPDELPSQLYDRLGLMHHDRAYRAIHYPESLEEASEAKRTLSFTELLLLEIKALRDKSPRQRARSLPSRREKALISSLPFSLTPDQESCLQQIREDLDSPAPMSRLLQGDVGSGKTLVAWLSALHVIDSGGQVAFMAPTELLARQHAEGAAELLAPQGVRIAFLTGSVRGEGRRLLLRSLKEGTTDLVIGTHALFSEDVEFHALRYAIIDEQHRFGVQQREALRGKGMDPDVLSMSATPIPRTLALTLFADLDVSTIHTMPSGRIPITTYLVKEDSREKMFSAISVEFRRGHQAYFVYPRIGDDGESDLRDVTTMYDNLKAVFPGVPSALIHSRLDEDEKMRILRDFRSGRISYLVATSVVEVGIDIPNATCMVIEHADRFGLAALHQLRGRVGRSTLPSYCFLVYGRSLSEDAKARLRVMRDTNDGFRIAEKDLEIRGPGEIAGDRQSGFLRLRFASITESPELVELARTEAEAIITEDRGLLKAENAVLRKSLQD